VNYDLLIDEVTNINKQNSKYRGLILENDAKFELLEKELQDIQKHVALKNKAI
jgi:hypothetical protein